MLVTRRPDARRPAPHGRGWLSQGGTCDAADQENGDKPVLGYPAGHRFALGTEGRHDRANNSEQETHKIFGSGIFGSAICGSARTASTAEVAAGRRAGGLADGPRTGCGFPGIRVRRAAAPSGRHRARRRRGERRGG